MTGERRHQGKHRARTKVNGHSVFLGWYPSREEARAAVVRYRKRRGLIIDPTAAGLHTRRVNRSLGLHS